MTLPAEDLWPWLELGVNAKIKGFRHCQELAATADPYITGEPLSEVFWRVVICDCDLDCVSANEEYCDCFTTCCEVMDNLERWDSTHSQNSS